ncbi:MAG: hypothetical protein GC168_02545 [Candidatus Hydrogenedens sp.]|nr:hypothetical protein [Candidatus Hydrogenedens sp.]
MKKQAIALMCLGVLIAGCAGEQDSRYVRDGKQYGVTEDGVFRGRWWSYYERGASYLAGGFYDEAIADFEVALRGRDRDSWRARTYGLHFVEFFPNRELGVAYFEQGNLDTAEEYLKRSVGQIETERALKYLDDIKRARIASGVVQDASAPELSAVIKFTRLIPSPGAAAPKAEQQSMAVPPRDMLHGMAAQEAAVFASTNAVFAQANPFKPVASVPPPPAEPEPVELDGKMLLAEPLFELELDTQDDNGVSEVTIGGNPLYQRGSQTSNSQTKELSFAEGAHTLALKATDLADKTVEQQVEVVVDLTAPTIGVFSPIEPTVTEEGTIILEGSGVDTNGVSGVSIDQRLIADGGGRPQVDFDSELPLGDGANSFILAARDQAGNEGRTAVKVFRGDADSLEAKLWLLEQKYPERLRFALADTRLLDALLAATPAQAGHEIRIKSPALDRPYYHNRTLQISGEVVTQTKVASLLINGEPFTNLTGAPKESFNRRIPIDRSEFVNGALTKTITIAAKDVDGNELTKEFAVEVKEVGTSNEASKMPVAVLGFAGYQGVSEDRPPYLQLATTGALNDLNRFSVLDRTRLEQVLTEQQLSADIGDPGQALEIGRVIPAQAFLMGDVFSFGKGLELKTRVISTESTEVLKTLDVYIEDASTPELLEQGAQRLAAMMAQEFPRLVGSVLEVRASGSRTQLRLDLTDDKLEPGRYVVLVSKTPDEVDPDTGEVIWPGEEVIVGRARIDNVTSTGSTATLVETNESQETTGVAQGMPAVTM